MPRGGARPGERRGGRKKGSQNKRTAEKYALIEQGGAMPLDIMLGAARAAWSEAQGEGGVVDLLKAKLAADIAKDAAPYVHARLASIEHKGPDDGPIQIILSGADASL